jgi:hypothetical protein
MRSAAIKWLMKYPVVAANTPGVSMLSVAKTIAQIFLLTSIYLFPQDMPKSFVKYPKLTHIFTAKAHITRTLRFSQGFIIVGYERWK